MNIRDVKNDYFSWLYDKCGFAKEGYITYNIVMLLLFKKEFYSMVPYDENREADSRVLRDRFVNENYDNEDDAYEALDFLCGTASMLEVMIALAERMDSDLYNPENDRTPIVTSFRELFTNLELNEFEDRYFARNWGYAEFEKVTKRVIDRTYKPNGKGGFFPLKHAKKDQREVELWYQMQAYLIENYGLG